MKEWILRWSYLVNVSFRYFGRHLWDEDSSTVFALFKQSVELDLLVLCIGEHLLHLLGAGTSFLVAVVPVPIIVAVHVHIQTFNHGVFLLARDHLLHHGRLLLFPFSLDKIVPARGPLFVHVADEAISSASIWVYHLALDAFGPARLRCKIVPCLLPERRFYIT